MKLKFLLFSFAIHLLASGIAQSPLQQDLLDRFIVMHNDGSEAVIQDFIKGSYHPELLKELSFDKHIDFYKHVIADFGVLNPEVYQVILEEKNKLIIHLIKAEESLDNQNIDPAEILTVEIDTHPDQPKYLSRGLGLGALVCTPDKK